MTTATRLSVPLLDLTRQYAELRDEILAEASKVFASQKFILGEQGAAFEREIGAYLEASHAIGVSSGTDALLAALIAVGVGSGDEVIVPAFSFFATAGVVSRLNAVPVFADVDPETLTLAPEAFEARIGPKTRAVVPVHLYGQAADLDPILDVARRRGIRVVEDACQAIGARYRGRTVGTFGEIGAFSFFPTKNLGAAGDAGLVTSEDADLAARLRRLRVHGMEPKYVHHEIGGNFRLDELQAAVLRVKLRRLDGWNADRRRVAELYRRELAGAGVRLAADMVYTEPVHHVFPVFTPNRDRLLSALVDSGIGASIHYPVPVHLQPAFADLGYHAGALPVSERLAGETLSLPMYPELDEEAVGRVARTLRRHTREG